MRRFLFTALLVLAALPCAAEKPKAGTYSFSDLTSSTFLIFDIRLASSGNFGVSGKLVSAVEDSPLKGTLRKDGHFKGEIKFHGKPMPIEGQWDEKAGGLALWNLPLLGSVTATSDSKATRGKVPQIKDPMDFVADTWEWSFAKPGEELKTHGSVTFTPSKTDPLKGTMSWTGGQSGTWTQSGRVVTLQWSHMNKVKDTMTLSVNGKTLDGTNSAGWKVKGTR